MFADIDTEKVQKEDDRLVSYYKRIVRSNDGLMTLDTVKLDDRINELISIDSEEQRRDAVACLHIYMQLLFRYSKGIYDVMRIPDFDI